MFDACSVGRNSSLCRARPPRTSYPPSLPAEARNPRRRPSAFRKPRGDVRQQSCLGHPMKNHSLRISPAVAHRRRLDCLRPELRPRGARRSPEVSFYFVSTANCLSENRLGEGDSPILLRRLHKIGTVPHGFRIGSKRSHRLVRGAGVTEPATWRRARRRVSCSDRRRRRGRCGRRRRLARRLARYVRGTRRESTPVP